MENDVQKSGAIFVYSDELAWFDFGDDHFFKPERAAKTYELCNRYGVMGYEWMKMLIPERPDDSLLNLFHEGEYIQLLKKAGTGEFSLEMLERGIGTQDNPILPGIFEWSLKVTGGTVAAINSILKGEVLNAFNPLGGFHHAGKGNAEGFCYVNDIVIAIKDALKKYPGIKILYLDIDAHHGNGVQDAFYNDPNVLFMSIHETGRLLYPWSGNENERGEGAGRGYTINIPLEPDSDDEVFSYAFDEVILPLVKTFAPDLIVAELGADTLISDPLTHLKLTNNGYMKAVKKIIEICPRILALGGGGYDLYRTARCWTLAWSALNNLEPVDEFAGLVGGMMFGPEMEVGSLFDHPHTSTGEEKEKAMTEVKRVVEYLKKEIFPLHGI
ncbi:MAG: acetoin utilization protein AcuC [Desulfobacteraceae bacterium]|jgi:acetoin utilization protein AcuC